MTLWCVGKNKLEQANRIPESVISEHAMSKNIFLRPHSEVDRSEAAPSNGANTSGTIDGRKRGKNDEKPIDIMYGERTCTNIESDIKEEKALGQNIQDEYRHRSTDQRQ